MKVRTLALALALSLLGFGLGWFAPGAAVPAHAQRSGMEIPIRVNAGDTFDLTMDIAVADSEAFEAYSARIVMGLTVEEMGPQGGVWRWSFEEFSLIDFTGGPEFDATLGDIPLGPGLDRALSAGLRLMTDLDFVCRVNAQGACVELLNWPQWRERIENVILLTSGTLLAVETYQNNQTVSASAGMNALEAALGAQSSESPAPASSPQMAMVANALDAVSGVILDAMDGRTVGMMMALPYITDVQGLSLREGQSQPTEALYPLPFGATPIRFTGTVTLDDVDRRAGVARFTRTASLDAASVTSGLTSMLQNGSGPVMTALTPLLPPGTMGEDPQAAADFMVSMFGTMMASFVFTIEETGSVEVDLNTGLARSGSVTQTLLMSAPDGTGLANQTTTTTFTLTPVAPRGPRLGAAAAQEG